MTIKKFKEKFGGYFPKDGYDAVICDKCKKDLAFYDTEDDDDPFRDRLYMNDAFYNDGGDAIYCCNHCLEYVDGDIETYTSFDSYVEDQKKMINELDMLSEEAFFKIWKEGNDGNDGLMHKGQYTKFIIQPPKDTYMHISPYSKLDAFRMAFIEENIGKTIVITSIHGDYYIQ